MPTELNIKISHKELREGLQKMIHSEHSVLISEIIIANLVNTPVGLEQLFKAFLGLRTIAKFKVLDRVKFNVDDYLYAWNYSKEKTQEKGLIHQNLIRGIVTKVNLQSDKPYEVEYTAVDSQDKEFTKTVYLSDVSIILDNDGLI